MCIITSGVLPLAKPSVGHRTVTPKQPFPFRKGPRATSFLSQSVSSKNLIGICECYVPACSTTWILPYRTTHRGGDYRYHFRDRYTINDWSASSGARGNRPVVPSRDTQ